MTKHNTVCSFLMIVSTLSLLQCVECLECYQCMFLKGITAHDLGYEPDDPYLKLNDSCESAPTSEYLQNCSDATICHSNIVEAYSQSDDKTLIKIVDRGCVKIKKLNNRMEVGCETFESFEHFREKQNGSQKVFPFEKKLSSTMTATYTRCHCDQDACNNSSSHGPTVYFLFIFLVAGLLTYDF